MFQEVKGEYNTAKIYTDIVDENALAQIKSLCDQKYAKGLKIRIMPDVHAGAGCTIGTTMTIRDAVVPNLVGVDIGCGMETIQLRNRHIELEKLDKLIYAKIPSGYNIRETAHKFNDEVDLTGLKCRREANLNLDRAVRSLGTLGGGNHFIEVDQDGEGNLYLVVHSGSRHLGLEVAGYYQEQAYRELNGNTKQDAKALIADYRAQGREKEIEKALKALKKQVKTQIPPMLAYCQGALMDDYIHDMKIVQRFAMLNRKAI
ncbi:MAG: RtcB family protein, partial [Lachnospiraceae bacterium]|nr:RtcB family protein [Lachnospiraceae bacterium]